MDAGVTSARPARWRAYAPAWLVLVLGLAVSGLSARWLWLDAERADVARFQTMVTNLVEHLDNRTERYVQEVEWFADRLANQPEISEGVWQEGVTRTSPASNLPALLELAYLTNAAMATREDLISGRLVWTNVLKKPQYNIRRGAPPLEGAFQWRMNSEPKLSDTVSWIGQPLLQFLVRGTLNGRLIATPRRLVPAIDANAVATVSIFVPIFMPDVAELTRLIPNGELTYTRSQRMRGLVVGTLGWQAFLATALPGEMGQVAFEAFADTNVTAEAWMGLEAGAPSRVLAPDFRPKFQHTQVWPFWRQSWRLVFYSTPLFDKQSLRFRAWGVLGGGGALALLLATLLAVQVRARLRQEVISGQLREALDELDAARRERERLSHDLHDGTIQSLYALQLGLSRAGEQALAALPALGSRLGEYRRNLTAVIGELRGYILRHEAGDGPVGDLAGVLTAVVDRLRSTTETVFDVELSAEAAARLSGEQAVHLANLARESLSNALRHAQPNRVGVALRAEDGRVILEVVDDGLGFDPTQPPHVGVGLKSMAARAREAGGELQIESRGGAGTRIRVSVPAASLTPQKPE